MSLCHVLRGYITLLRYIYIPCLPSKDRRNVHLPETRCKSLSRGRRVPWSCSLHPLARGGIMRNPADNKGKIGKLWKRRRKGGHNSIVRAAVGPSSYRSYKSGVESRGLASHLLVVATFPSNFLFPSFSLSLFLSVSALFISDTPWSSRRFASQPSARFAPARVSARATAAATSQRIIYRASFFAGNLCCHNASYAPVRNGGGTPYQEIYKFSNEAPSRIRLFAWNEIYTCRDARNIIVYLQHVKAAPSAVCFASSFNWEEKKERNIRGESLWKKLHRKMAAAEQNDVLTTRYLRLVSLDWVGAMLINF